MTAKEPSVNFIEVRFSDGKIMRAEGRDADAIWKWIQTCETMNFIHGGKFSGKPLTEVER